MLPNSWEIICGADSDQDFIDDHIEIALGLNPNNPDDASLDVDFDERVAARGIVIRYEESRLTD